MLAAVPFDLEKAFDQLVRDDIWRALEDLADSWGFVLFEERLYDCTYYMIRYIKSQAVISEGSVEGPALSIAVYEFVVRDIQSARTAGFDPVRACFGPTLRRRREDGCLLFEDPE